MEGPRSLHTLERPLLPYPLFRHGGVRLLPSGPAQHAAQAWLDLPGPSRRPLPAVARSLHGIARPRTLVGHRQGTPREPPPPPPPPLPGPPRRPTPRKPPFIT